ncbi:unnamed protein product, partial [Oncorhynchus mykiss]
MHNHQTDCALSSLWGTWFDNFTGSSVKKGSPKTFILSSTQLQSKDRTIDSECFNPVVLDDAFQVVNVVSNIPLHMLFKHIRYIISKKVLILFPSTLNSPTILGTPCTNFKGVVTQIDSTDQVDSNCSLSTGNASVPSNLTTVNVLNKNPNVNCCCTTMPEVIMNLTASEITTSSVFLNWTEPLGNRSSYRVEWTDGKTSGSQNTPETSFNVTALTAGVQYLFTVTAVAGDNTTVGQSKTVSKYTSKYFRVGLFQCHRYYSALVKYSAPLNFATFCHISSFKHK